jgi:rhodanese-related sulfurtransferase
MSMATVDELTLQQRNLFQQGYQSYTPTELKQLEWGLRFTPAACSVLAIIGLVYQLPYLLFAVSLLGIWAFFFPAGHPMDLIYNHGVRHLFGAMKLPANPLQRRLACLSAGVMNFTAAVLFLVALPTAARIVGAILVSLQAVVITSHFCTLSWMYEGILRMLGKWSVPIDSEGARRLVSAGARLVDVRGPSEFQKANLEGSVNIPLEELEGHLDGLRDLPALLYCSGGIRSQIGMERLKKLGLTEVHNLGSLSRAEKILT